MNVTQKLLSAHLVLGDLTPGREIAIRIDQTLTQDSTGTMAYLQFEAMGIPRVKTEKSVAYIDHNTLQTGFENADDHRYITTVAARHGIYLSKPGNGICHQVHLERVGKPGKTLLGSDSHTPTGGALGMLAIGAGGLDVAVAMGGGAYYLSCPRVVNVRLTGRLSRGVAAKDVILELLRRLSVKGGVGKVMEYTGDGVKTLSIPERATIANMGAELGATTSVFPSDEVTRAFLEAQGRGGDYAPLAADPDAAYDETVEIDLSALEPMVALPHMPDNVKTVAEAGPVKVDQVCIGSCTNSSYQDMMRVAAILRGKTVHPDVSLVVAPGSRQVLSMLSQNGALHDMIEAGARICETACGFCIGMGQSPCTNGVSVRTNNRNFFGRSGTKSAGIYLVSCETAAATALTGVLTDPRGVDACLDVPLPQRYAFNDNLLLAPDGEGQETQVVRGPNIQPFPKAHALEERLEGRVLLKMEDNITTDHIMPSDSSLLPFRSNIPKLSQHCLAPVDPTFPQRAREAGGGFLLAGQNYGQGSSREHAALVPLYLKVRGVLAKSFARIHRANLINNGILPLEFVDEADYDRFSQEDVIALEGVAQLLRDGAQRVPVTNLTRGFTVEMRLEVTPRQRDMLLEGGLIRMIAANAEK
ncbi:MAG TPA: aconitate hydratase [Candidatus Limiplasma stercoravium]|nr:aconitate hydratase [Candidatus Limiplasma stercoravium]